MEQKNLPQVFRQLLAEGCLEQAQILNTADGFFLAYRSLSDILADKGIFDFPDAQGQICDCGSFFDDWFLYAVSGERDHTYSLLKLREQEHDAENGAPADGDTPGVTVSFIAFDCGALLGCLAEPVAENRQKLAREINRVVVYRKQRHHRALKKYFAAPESDGAYLVADLYTKHIAAMAEKGYLEVPQYYKQILQQSISYKNVAKFARLPRFLEQLNQEAGYVVCDHEKIYIRDRHNPDPYERAAILATHAGNTSVFSFAAEVEYHAKFLIPLARIRIPFFGKSIYESAIRADMTVGDTEFEGPAPFYRPDSPMVKRQYRCHKDRG